MEKYTRQVSVQTIQQKVTQADTDFTAVAGQRHKRNPSRTPQVQEKRKPRETKKLKEEDF